MASSAKAQQSNEELAKQLANPISSLISVPFQLNWDQNIGAADAGERLTLNVQPVIPFDISDDWNLITRTILPVVSQDDIFPGAGSQFGLGDTVQSLWFSPKAPTSNGWIWGAGPAFLLPTATDELLGTDKWGVGPTGVALKQQGPFTFGGLANHIWSVAGDSDRADVNSTFLQPFFTYTTPSAWSFTAVAEATYDWESEQWSVPVGLITGKVFRLGSQTVQFNFGPRYYVEHTDGGPEGLGLRAVFILLFPTGH
ncbi:transporter [Marinihelvus fidelis]|uniref:Transporter n=2 Tax=Marinihelvus fidelis TaxID=2613842 RepID=A0A5N0THY9_9GAMM|nr:transporter [Marinihelvus fidelis]